MYISHNLLSSSVPPHAKLTPRISSNPSFFSGTWKSALYDQKAEAGSKVLAGISFGAYTARYMLLCIANSRGHKKWNSRMGTLSLSARLIHTARTALFRLVLSITTDLPLLTRVSARDKHRSRVPNVSWLTCSYPAGKKCRRKKDVLPHAGEPTKITISISSRMIGVFEGTIGGTVLVDQLRLLRSESHLRAARLPRRDGRNPTGGSGKAGLDIPKKCSYYQLCRSFTYLWSYKSESSVDGELIIRIAVIFTSSTSSNSSCCIPHKN
jgi:hypothetical protein